MGIFGWSYPPGCSGTPADEDRQCEVCGGWDIDPKHAVPGKVFACICGECSECGEVGNPGCYKKVEDGGHGLVLLDTQRAQAAAVLERQRLDDESMAQFADGLDGMDPQYVEEMLDCIPPQDVEVMAGCIRPQDFSNWRYKYVRFTDDVVLFCDGANMVISHATLKNARPTVNPISAGSIQVKGKRWVQRDGGSQTLKLPELPDDYQVIDKMLQKFGFVYDRELWFTV